MVWCAHAVDASSATLSANLHIHPACTGLAEPRARSPEDHAGSAQVPEITGEYEVLRVQLRLRDLDPIAVVAAVAAIRTRRLLHDARVDRACLVALARRFERDRMAAARFVTDRTRQRSFIRSERRVVIAFGLDDARVEQAHRRR